MKTLALLCTAFLMACALTGCGGGGGGGGTKTGPTGPGTLVTKVAGGTVSSGKAVVVIPPNALAADTTILVQPAPGTLPAAPTNFQILGASAFDLTPNGTEFSTPASLTITYSPASIPAGVPETSLAIYTVASGAWQVIDGSTVNTVNHTISVPLAHFSVYAVLSPSFVGSGPIYTVVDIGILPGDAGSIPAGISSNGLVVGTSSSAAGTLHAFLWSNGALTDLGHRTGYFSAKAYAVNSSRTAGGISLPDFSSAFPVLFQNGTVTQVNTAFGPIGGSVTAVNDHGDYIVSNAINKGGTLTSFLGFTPAPEAQALNSVSDVAGSAGNTAAIWRSGAIVSVGVLPGYDSSAGTALSDNGLLVGTASVNGTNTPVGFILSGGTMLKISPVSGDDIALPEGVNNNGQVVGTSSADFVTARGFLYENGVTSDLNSLISSISGWQILHAYGINNNGQIIAYGVNAGVQHALLLNPIKRAVKVLKPVTSQAKGKVR